jgi:DNA-directed RNA polymerase subunit RPC12/RpoP
MSDFTPGDQSDDNNIICPHCGSSTRADSCDGDANENPMERECSECRKVFESWGEISITYHTRAKETKL